MSLRIELPAYTARTQLLGTGRWAEAGMARDRFEMEMNAQCGHSKVAACVYTPASKRMDIALAFTLEAPCLLPRCFQLEMD